MKSCEKFIFHLSDYYNYTPSLDAKRAFFYPICTGHFIYEAGYHQYRNSFDSFLLMYIRKGELKVNLKDRSEIVTSNHFVLLDCYKPHGYRAEKDCECLWIHFDGPVARFQYEMIVSRLGNFFQIGDSYPIYKKMQRIYDTFAKKETIQEAMLSKQFSDILTSFLLFIPQEKCPDPNSASLDTLISYMHEHFMDKISLEQLAKEAMLSPYYFIRIFKKETGFTPHEYLISIRINNAKYLLKTTRMSIKDICFETGFSSESVFCTSFKKNVGITPAQYRIMDAVHSV